MNLPRGILSSETMKKIPDVLATAETTGELLAMISDLITQLHLVGTLNPHISNQAGITCLRGDLLIKEVIIITILGTRSLQANTLTRGMRDTPKAVATRADPMIKVLHAEAEAESDD